MSDRDILVENCAVARRVEREQAMASASQSYEPHKSNNAAILYGIEDLVSTAPPSLATTINSPQDTQQLQNPLV